MKQRADLFISHEDRILWQKVARTATPLKGRGVKDALDPFLVDDETPEAGSPPQPVGEAAARPQHPKDKSAKPHHGPQRLDEPTHRKIAKGRLSLGARLDLHGLNQGEAHGLLLAFLHRAHTEGLRHVLVITGKGASFGSDGVLRQAVPHWFSTPLFKPYVGAYEDAARHHGGHGAIYVRLRRKNAVTLA
jgi:DNA-nicking Smr family endonuclease